MTNFCRVVGAALLLVVGAFACSPTARPEDEQLDRRRIVLISIDTCRADHLSSYGFSENTTPNIDALAQDGVTFTRAYTSTPITRPAHASLLTGLIPPIHGVRDNAHHSLDPSEQTLAEVLGADGFSTAGVVSAFVLDSQFGLDQGFDVYDDEFQSPIEELGVLTRLGEETSRKGIALLDRFAEDDLFLFLHYWDPHVEYKPPEPFLSRFSGDAYAGEIAYTDFCIGQVIDELKRRGLYEQTLIIVTADHGEMLGEHGENQHGFFVYRSSVRVPLIIKLPGEQLKKTVNQPVGLVDILPTVCSIYEIACPAGLQGRDLGTSLKSEVGSFGGHEVYTESLWPTKYGGAPLTSIIAGSLQFIDSPFPELYDLVRDPDQQENLAPTNPEKVMEFEAMMKSTEEMVALRTQPEAKASDLDPEARQKLRTLGYLADLPVDETIGDGGTNAKALIGLHEASSRVLTLMSQDRLDEAQHELKAIIQQWPDSPQAYLDLGWVALKRGQADAAVEVFEQYLQLMPASSMGQYQYGMALAATSRREAAVEAFSEALRLMPGYGDAAEQLGVQLSRLGRFKEAASAFEIALAANPESFRAQLGLGEALARSGRESEAERHFRRAAELEPDNLDVTNTFGLFLIASGELDEAVDLFVSAISRAPDRPQLHFNLALALGRLGRRSEAIDAYRKVLALDQSVAAAHVALGDLLYEIGDPNGAARSWEDAVALGTTSAEAFNSLAWVLATGEVDQPDGPERAVILAREACRLTKERDPAMLDTLATALAADGQMVEAMEISIRASDLARSIGQQDLAVRIEKRRENFR